MAEQILSDFASSNNHAHFQFSQAITKIKHCKRACLFLFFNAFLPPEKQNQVSAKIENKGILLYVKTKPSR